MVAGGIIIGGIGIVAACAGRRGAGATIAACGSLGVITGTGKKRNV
jgi:hypothetical protein